MDKRPKAKKTKFQKVMKWMGIVELSLLVIFLIWLFGFKISLGFYEVDEVSEGEYILGYKGEIYYGTKDFIWWIDDSKFIGFVNGLSNKAYKSTGNDKNKFIEVWDFFNVHLMGYGTFVREDIELEPPSSSNIATMTFPFDIEAGEEVKDGVLETFDAYNNGILKAIAGTEFRKNSSEEIVSFGCSHSNYQLKIHVTLYSSNDNYYLHIWTTDYYIPIISSLGELIEGYA